MESHTKKKPVIAILTGGGDVPGLNPASRPWYAGPSMKGSGLWGFGVVGQVCWNIIPMPQARIWIIVSMNLTNRRSEPSTEMAGPIYTPHVPIRVRPGKKMFRVS